MSWGVGCPQILPEFQAVLLTQGWGHPEPEPSVPGGGGLAPRESVHCVLPHEETDTGPFPGPLPQPCPAPSSRTWSSGGSHSAAPIWLPTAPGKNHPQVQLPGSSGGCRGWGRSPALCLKVGAGRLSSCWGWGDWQAGCPSPSRAQMQEVQRRQRLHTYRGPAADPDLGEPECRRPKVGEPWRASEPTPVC